MNLFLIKLLFTSHFFFFFVIKREVISYGSLLSILVPAWRNLKNVIMNLLIRYQKETLSIDQALDEFCSKIVFTIQEVIKK